jgi:hypothetical protein
MPEGRNQQVAVDVRVLIHHHPGKPAAEKNEPLLQVFSGYGAEDAGVGFIMPQNIIHPPGGPEDFHKKKTIT